MIKIINSTNYKNAYKILNKQLEFVLNGMNPGNIEFNKIFTSLGDETFSPEIPDTNKLKFINTNTTHKKAMLEYSEKEIKDIYNNHIESDDFIKNTYSEKSLYLKIGSVFKTKYIKDTQEELIALYKNKNTSEDDKKILSDILVYCNIPIVLNQVKAQMFGKGGEVNSKYANIEEGDVLTQGILILKKAIIEYDNKSIGKFKIKAIGSKVVGNTLEITINTDKNKIKSVNLDFWEENFNKKESETLNNYIIDGNKIHVSLNELPENFNINGKIHFISKDDKKIKGENDVFVKIEYNAIKLITFITTRLKFGIQAYLLKSSGVKVSVMQDVIYNKIGYATKLYQRLYTDMVDYNIYEDIIYNNVKEKTINNDPFYDDYYDNIKNTNNEIKIQNNENPSLRWLAIFLILNKKEFEIIKIDDKYDIFIKKDNVKNKDSNFKINYEKLVFTDKTEKLIRKTMKDIEKSISMISNTNVLSFDMKIGDDDETTLGDMLIDVDAEDYSDINKRIDNEKYIELLKMEFKNILKNNKRISKEMRILIKTFINELDLEEVKKVSEKMKNSCKTNSMFISFKRIFGIANIIIKEKLEKKYGKSVFDMF